MTCETKRVIHREQLVLFQMSGYLQAEHVNTIEELIANEITSVVLDLSVRLVDRGAVMFIADCDVGGIRLRHCPAFIREWINKV